MKKFYSLLIIGLFASLSFAQTKKDYYPSKPVNSIIVNKADSKKVRIESSGLANMQVFSSPLQDLKSFDFSPSIEIAADPLVAIYPTPPGALYVGMTPEYMAVSTAVQLKAPAQVTIPFIPYTNNENATFSWAINNGSIDLNEEVNEYGVLDHYLSILPDGYIHYMPELTGTAGNEKVTFKLGQNVQYQEIYAGHNETEGLTLVNNNLNRPSGGNLYTGYQNGDNFGPSYSFEGVPCDGILSVMPQMTSPLYTESVDVFVYAPNGAENVMPADGELKLELFYLDENGNFGEDLIATATATSENYTDAGNNHGSFRFIFKDIEDGFVTEVPITIGTKARIAVLITGFDQNWDINFFMGANPVQGSAYTVHGDKIKTFAYSNSPNTPANDLYINFNGIFNCLAIDEATNNLTIPVEGGLGTWYDSEENKSYNNVIVFSSFGISEANDLWMVDISDWLKFSYSDEYFETDKVLFFYLEGEALPNGINGRLGSLTLGSYGVTATINVKQGDVTGIDNNEIEITKAVRQGENFLLSYPKGVNVVSVYNLAGQCIGEYQLNESGQYILPAQDLTNGVYILKFKGNKNINVKILK